MMGYIMKFFTYIMNYFTIEYSDLDILDQASVVRRRNIIVNRVLFIINILVSIFIIANPNNQINEVTVLDSLSLIVPTIGINILMAYFVSHDKNDMEKQTFGMYIVILSIVYLVLRVYFLHPTLYTYVLIYLALVMISLFQNRNAMLLGDVMIFVIATIFHILAFDENQYQNIIPDQIKPYFAVSIYTLFLLLFMFVITSIVLFSEYMDNERKRELTKRNELEGEFKQVIWNVFDTIEDFSESIADRENKGIYKIGLISKKIAGLNGFNEQKSIELFNYSIIHGVHQDFSTHLGREQKELLLEDYQQLKYKLDTGNQLIRRIRISNKCDEMLRSRYESWLLSQSFKKLKSEDSTIENQIVLLAETYVLLRDKKSYKKALTHVKAIKELTDNFNHFFDQDLLNLFLEHHVEFEIIYENN